MSIDVDYRGLSDDAARWLEVSSALGAAAAVVPGLALGHEFSFVGDLAGLPGIYAELIDFASRVLAEGRDVTSGIADTLLDVRAAYESADATERAKYNTTWIPK